MALEALWQLDTIRV